MSTSTSSDRLAAFRAFADARIDVAELARRLGMAQDEARAAFEQWRDGSLSKRDRAADVPAFKRVLG